MKLNTPVRRRIFTRERWWNHPTFVTWITNLGLLALFALMGLMMGHGAWSN